MDRFRSVKKNGEDFYYCGDIQTDEDIETFLEETDRIVFGHFIEYVDRVAITLDSLTVTDFTLNILHGDWTEDERIQAILTKVSVLRKEMNELEKLAMEDMRCICFLRLHDLLQCRKFTNPREVAFTSLDTISSVAYKQIRPVLLSVKNLIVEYYKVTAIIRKEVETELLQMKQSKSCETKHKSKKEQQAEQTRIANKSKEKEKKRKEKYEREVAIAQAYKEQHEKKTRNIARMKKSGKQCKTC